MTTTSHEGETTHGQYIHPLMSRYCSREMLKIFSDDEKYRTWRRIWYVLACAQHETFQGAQCGPSLGIIPEAALKDLLNIVSHAAIDYKAVEEAEMRTKHDVMAHLSVLGALCPTAKPFLHLGATSCDITDNADILIIKQALFLVLRRLYVVIDGLQEFAGKWQGTPCLSYTHFQAAQLTTIGKRAAIWLQDLIKDFKNIHAAYVGLQLRGLKGTTGTQASFLALFNNDAAKVIDLESRFCALLGFKVEDAVFPITGQTYSRKQDCDILYPLSSLAATANKICTDVRLLSHSQQVEEPFDHNGGQVGSSAMAYKRNPMKSERCCSLARHAITLIGNSLQTFGNQWLERSLDDSANRRITLSESFLTADAILLLLHSITSRLQVNTLVVDTLVKAELPLMATENILIAIVKAGGDRQVAHEIIRAITLESKEQAKASGALMHASLLPRLMEDPYFLPIKDQMASLMNVDNFLGLAPLQVSNYLVRHVKPLLACHKDEFGSLDVSFDIRI